MAAAPGIRHIDGDNIDIALEPVVLKSVIQNKAVHGATLHDVIANGMPVSADAHASPRERVEYEKRIAEINRNPTERLRWNGFSYATWHSYRGDNTLRALRGLQLPTLAILGARDRVIDLKTTIVDLMLVSENQPIQLHVFGECGHDFTKHWLHVSRVLGRFLSDQVGLQ